MTIYVLCSQLVFATPVLSYYKSKQSRNTSNNIQHFTTGTTFPRNILPFLEINREQTIVIWVWLTNRINILSLHLIHAVFNNKHQASTSFISCMLLIFWQEQNEITHTRILKIVQMILIKLLLVATVQTVFFTRFIRISLQQLGFSGVTVTIVLGYITFTCHMIIEPSPMYFKWIWLTKQNWELIYLFHTALRQNEMRSEFKSQ